LVEDTGVQLVQHAEQSDAPVVSGVAEVSCLGDADNGSRHMMDLFQVPHQAAVLLQHADHGRVAVLQQLIDDALLSRVTGLVGLEALQALADLGGGDGGVKGGGAVVAGVGFEQVHLYVAMHLMHVSCIEVGVISTKQVMAAKPCIMGLECFSNVRC